MDIKDNELFETLSNSADNVFIFQTDMKTNYSIWSNNAIEYFDLPEDYHTRVLDIWLERIHADDRQAYLDDINSVLSGKKEKHCIQYRAKNRYGDYVWLECNGNVARYEDGQLKLFAGIITRIDNMSKYDPLTKKLLSHQFYIQDNSDESLMVLLLGMDKFRSVITGYGYEAGNEILIAMANELEKPDMKQSVYRMNGDEFLVVIPSISQKDAIDFYNAVSEGFKVTCQQKNFVSSITFSVAAEEYVPNKYDKETLIKRLEHSMEHAKSQGGGRLVFFSEEIENRHKRVYEVSKALDKSITNGFEGFEIYYQPIVTAQDEKIRTVEALLRFHTDELGFVSPAEFIPILENTRDIIKCGMWVMEQVIKQNKIWNEKYHNIKTGFNVSYIQLYNDSLINEMIRLVKEYGVDPKLVTLELTESCKVVYPESLSSMFERIMNYGINVALDDFGMEHSTLTILKDIPVTSVKIEHSFVRTIKGDRSRQDETNLAIISGIITICKKLSYKVVVEGVETVEMANLMKGLGADYLQGFYFSKPIPANEVEKFF